MSPALSRVSALRIALLIMNLAATLDIRDEDLCLARPHGSVELSPPT
ncbi:hypothetical protein [Amycolatopsis sp. NPDC051372]